MKLHFFLTPPVLLSILSATCFSQTEQQIIPGNGSVTGLEHNLLFNAQNHYTVTQSGAAQVPLNPLFDGRLGVYYTSVAPTLTQPTVITIEGLPPYHPQRNGWVGWTTRYWPPEKFKIEVKNNKNGLWTTIADVENNANGSYMVRIPSIDQIGAYVDVTSVRFTIYDGNSTENKFGLSELFYINPEATPLYNHLLLRYNEAGNVGVGTNSSDAKLTVKGDIHAEEVRVDLTVPGPDYVFEKDYNLPTLKSLQNYIEENKHLPEVPSAKEMEANGIDLGVMNMLLLKKVEELTLYVLELKSENNQHLELIKNLQSEVTQLKNQ